MPPGQDPLQKFAGPLAAVLIAVAVSVILAAMIGGAMPFDYMGRALVYLGVLLYVVAGAVVMFRVAAAGESGSFSIGRIGKWVLSIWLWPLLLLARR